MTTSTAILHLGPALMTREQGQQLAGATRYLRRCIVAEGCIKIPEGLTKHQPTVGDTQSPICQGDDVAHALQSAGGIPNHGEIGVIVKGHGNHAAESTTGTEGDQR